MNIDILKPNCTFLLCLKLCALLRTQEIKWLDLHMSREFRMPCIVNPCYRLCKFLTSPWKLISQAKGKEFRSHKMSSEFVLRHWRSQSLNRLIFIGDINGSNLSRCRFPWDFPSVEVNSSHRGTHCACLLPSRFPFTSPLGTDTMGSFQGTQAHPTIQYRTKQAWSSRKENRF